MKNSRCKKIEARSSPRKRGPKKSRCKKSIPKRRYKKRCQTKSIRRSPGRRRSPKKCQTGMRKSPPPTGYELICGRLVKKCGPGKMRNNNGRCVDTPAVRIAKIIERLGNEGKNIEDYDIDMNNYKVLRKLALNDQQDQEGGDEFDKQAVWIKRDSCGRPVVNWKQKFMCGKWHVNNYTKNGVNDIVLELVGIAPRGVGDEGIASAEPGMEWVWKTSGKCGWPEKTIIKSLDDGPAARVPGSRCNKLGKAKNNILSLATMDRDATDL